MRLLVGDSELYFTIDLSKAFAHYFRSRTERTALAPLFYTHKAAFQAVCEALLHGGRRNPSLMSLPSIWLDKLLQQLDGSKQEVRCTR